jgi:hypothetical protein
MKMRSPFLLAALLVPLAYPLAARAASAPPAHIRGTIAAVSGNRVTITTAQGPVSVTFAAAFHVVGVVPGNVSDITSGTFIGCANVPGTGAARALEVSVFPKAMAGTGEGDYPWDLTTNGAMKSAMTNGTVAAPKTSAMTNGTVSRSSNGATKIVTLSYKGGTKTILISSDTPIVRIEPGTRSLLTVGAHVFAVAPGPGPGLVVVGEHGAVPPM